MDSHSLYDKGLVSKSSSKRFISSTHKIYKQKFYTQRANYVSNRSLLVKFKGHIGLEIDQGSWQNAISLVAGTRNRIKYSQLRDTQAMPIL